MPHSDVSLLSLQIPEEPQKGHRVLQIGESRKRDLDQKPYSQKELAHQTKFKTAQAQTSAALKDTTQKAALADEFKAVLKAGTTSCMSALAMV